jgi:hypothetical protein
LISQKDKERGLEKAILTKLFSQLIFCTSCEQLRFGQVGNLLGGFGVGAPWQA